MNTLLSIAYLPPISYLQECRDAEEITIEHFEHFIKQSYRNRACIYGPNGKQSLIIPVRHENLFRIPIRDVRISLDTPWNKIHWKAITAAYRNSPYFEFYEDDFKEIYDRPVEFLADFNFRLLELIFRLFKISKKISFTETFEESPQTLLDMRNKFHPKKNIVRIQPYHQVFAERHGFLNDLSCIDLLFNVGGKLMLSENNRGQKK